ncbi:MAG: cytochrome c maturation protein CcmE [Fimbriimonadaceae bacterium]|nr:cytochrome c maturation protein CcmE [Fimbriimonadaceae bacterium]
MKPVQIGALVVSILGLGVVLVAFLFNASPYVSVAEAKANERPGVHLVGDIVKGTMKVRPNQGYVRFTVKDAECDPLDVVYRGAPPGNMGNATRVVAVGGVKEGVFQADRIILKCPSKYEEEGGSASDPMAKTLEQRCGPQPTLASTLP